MYMLTSLCEEYKLFTEDITRRCAINFFMSTAFMSLHVLRQCMCLVTVVRYIFKSVLSL